MTPAARHAQDHVSIIGDEFNEHIEVIVPPGSSSLIVHAKPPSIRYAKTNRISPRLTWLAERDPSPRWFMYNQGES